MKVKEWVLEPDRMKVKEWKQENMMEIQNNLVMVCWLALVLVCNVALFCIWVLAYVMALGLACILV